MFRNLMKHVCADLFKLKIMRNRNFQFNALFNDSVTKKIKKNVYKESSKVKMNQIG